MINSGERDETFFDLCSTDTGAEVDAGIPAVSSKFHFATVFEAAALLALFAGTALWPGNAFT
ncbi:MAG: hypothetical protein OSB38_42900, partial [Paraburkholderia fungorum]|nr:hypothetical protein [Paraburkholderia fungorum]